MNGWLRLWVLVSVVWVVVVVSVAAIVIPEVAAPEVGSALSPKEAQKAVTDALTLYKENPDAPDAPELLARAERLNQYVLNYKPEKTSFGESRPLLCPIVSLAGNPPLDLTCPWIRRCLGVAWIRCETNDCKEEAVRLVASQVSKLIKGVFQLVLCRRLFTRVVTVSGFHS
jgi:hypothetical protein